MGILLELKHIQQDEFVMSQNVVYREKWKRIAEKQFKLLQ